MRPEVTRYIEQARSGDHEGAFHRLRELGVDALLDLRAAYHCETDPLVRSTIVEVVCEHRQPSEIAFLADALHDPAPDVWKAALDGLVILASVEAMQALRAAADREGNTERRAWIAEAIEQIEQTPNLG